MTEAAPAPSPRRDEKTSAAPGISPGVVADAEFLLREVFKPYHVENGNLLTRAVSLQDLRENGFSVHRMAYVDEEYVRRSIRERLAAPRSGEPWEDAGVAVMETSTVRALRLESAPAFAVVDTASQENPGHASIFAADPDRGNAYARKLRSLLLPLLRERKPVGEAFEEWRKTQAARRGERIPPTAGSPD